MYDYDRVSTKFAAKLDPTKRALAEKQLAAYGYTLSATDEIQRGEKSLKVFVSAKGPRFYAKRADGGSLWSGPDLGDFVATFWYAKKL